MPDFSFPQWMLKDSSFADSLLKGAQVGAIVANNRHRNQALAAHVADNERNYLLREKALESDQEQKNIMLKSKMLEMDTHKQIFADQVADKETLGAWISERNKLSPEERLNMPVPNLRLPASFNAANQIFDNDRMAYSESAKGKAAAALEFRVRQLPADSQYLFDTTEDPQEKLAILKSGEAALLEREKALKAIAPTIAAESRENVAEINATTRERLATLKSEAVTAKTQGVSESKFVDRHLNSVLDQLSFDKVHQKDTIEQKTKLATELLQKTYRESGMAVEVVPSSNRIRVKSPDGKIGTISSDKLNEALKQGYQRAE